MRRGRRLARLAVLVTGAALLVACQTTSVPGLRVRSEPTTDSSIVATMPRAQTNLVVDCRTDGQPINGDSVWYRITAPHRGFVTRHYVDDDERTATAPSC